MEKDFKKFIRKYGMCACLEDLACEERDGLLCTTVNQTIIDLLEQNGNEQIITESLANYYDAHNESFDGLEVPEHLKRDLRNIRHGRLNIMKSK